LFGDFKLSVKQVGNLGNASSAALLGPVKPWPDRTSNYFQEHAEWLSENAKILKQNPWPRSSQKNRLNGTRNLPYPVHFVTYGDDDFNETIRRIIRQAHRTKWFVTMRAYGPRDLPSDFSQQYADILGQQRGGGYWLWKFAVLEMALHRIPIGDFLLYLDAGSIFIKEGKSTFIEWLHMLQNSSSSGGQEILCFYSFRQPPPLCAENCRQITWTTLRTYEAFDLQPHPTDPLLSGSAWLVRNGPQMREMLALIYQVLAKDSYLITDKYNDQDNGAYFKDNRHDQSISSLALKKLQNYHTRFLGIKQITPIPFYVRRIRNVSRATVDEWEIQEARENAIW
jgi:hypothetical protein